MPTDDTLILYALPQSPYCAKVRAALNWKQIPFEEREPHGGSYQTTEYQSLVPLGSVPAIRQGDWILHDSQAILEYLEEWQPHPAIWSPDQRLRALQRSLVHYHDCRLEPTVRELVPLVKQPVSEEVRIRIGVVRDNLFDRLYRISKMLETDTEQASASFSAVDWTYPPTMLMARDILEHLGTSLKMPDSVEDWLGRSVRHPLVASEVDCVRGAIALWLKMESELVN